MIFYDGIIFTLQSGGGISTAFYELLKRLNKFEYVFETVLYHKDVQKLNGRIVYQKPKFLERYRQCNIERLQKKDLFHSTYYRLPGKKCKIVTSVHDFTYEKFFSRAKTMVHSWQKYKAIRGADKVICITESTKRDLLNFVPDITEDRISVVYNGVATDYHVLQSKPKWLEYRDYALFVGKRQGYKNFISVVNALSRIPTLSLICVGGGHLTNSERELLEKQMPGRYEHLGYVSNQTLNELYNFAFCLLYPSKYEGFGIPIIEAMSAGCPVIAVNRSCIPEVAGDAAVLLEKGDPDEIKRGIESLYINENRKWHMEAGICQSQKFSWDNTFKQTITIYEELIGPIICER